MSLSSRDILNRFPRGQTAMVRLYDDPSYCRLNREAPIPRTEAMEEILAEFRAATEFRLSHAGSPEGLFLQWAGYQPYQAAALPGQQHLTHIQLRPPVGRYRVEYVFPDGLSTAECDDLCRYPYASDGLGNNLMPEWLVTSTLAGVLHSDGVSLADYVIAFARGQTVMVGRLDITPTTPPTTLYAAVRVRGWSATVEWLRDTQTTLERALDEIRAGRAVWVPAAAPSLPWEPLFLQHRDGQGCFRLALGDEAAAYAGRRVEIAVSAAEGGDWLSDHDAEQTAGMSHGQWRRWIETHREVRVGRPIARNGQMATNRRLIHRGDLFRAIRLANAHNGEQICKGADCPQSCWKARTCPHRGRDCV